MNDFRCTKCGHLTNPFVSNIRDNKVVFCYARLDPKTDKWMWGCVRPDNRGIARIVMALIGKNRKSLDRLD